MFRQFSWNLIFLLGLQHTGWCPFVLHYWGPGGPRLPAECWGELWCGGLCRNAGSLHTWVCWNWQVNSCMFSLFCLYFVVHQTRQYYFGIFFSSFCSVKVCEMMFSLASKLAAARTTGTQGVFSFKSNTHNFVFYYNLYWWSFVCTLLSKWRKCHT